MDQPNFYHAVPRNVNLGPKDKTALFCSIEKRITYHNRTHAPITVVERSGLKFVVKPAASYGHEQEFIIRVQYKFDNAVRNNTQLLLDRLHTLTAQLQVFKEAFHCEANTDAYGGVRFTIEFPITHSALKGLGGSVFYKEIDTVISTADPENCPEHPESELGYMTQLVDLTNLESRVADDFFLQIRIIDNDLSYGDRFININGQIFRVKSNIDKSKRNGVFINRSPKEVPEEIGKILISETLTHAEATDKLRLFRTFDEAYNVGDFEMAKKKELADMEQANLLEKKRLESRRAELQDRELEQERVKLDQEKVKLDQERIKGDQERIKRENEIEKDNLAAQRAREDHQRAASKRQTDDYYDERSYQRKDSSETVKWLPTIIVGIGAVIVGFKTIFG